MSFALRVKTKSGQHVLRNLRPESTIRDLKTQLVNVTNFSSDHLYILIGFPPKEFDISNDVASLSDKGLTSGETLIVEERVILKNQNHQLDNHNTENSESFILNKPMTELPTLCQGVLLKKIVPADNSCLFSSIHFVLNRKLDETGSVGPWLRTLVAESISKESGVYSEAILGKPVDEYCAWIQDDKSWGGAIELSILSNYYGIEIAVVDTINAIINRFGEDQRFPHRVFLMFDGIHYDPLYMEPFNGGDIKTIFSSEDEYVLKEAELLAIEAKSSRQFTDVNKFTLKCLLCNVFLKGQVEAQQHAKTTGHSNFGEV